MNLSKVTHAGSNRGRPSLHLQPLASSSLRAHTHPFLLHTGPHFPTQILSAPPLPKKVSGFPLHINCPPNSSPERFNSSPLCSPPAFPTVTCLPPPPPTFTHTDPCIPHLFVLLQRCPAFPYLGAFAQAVLRSQSPSLHLSLALPHPNCSNHTASKNLSPCPQPESKVAPRFQGCFA